MAIVQLSAHEARLLGCLIEKSIVTPDQYPLTLNALTAACNQKSSREPVMSLDQGVVQRTARELEAKNLLRVDANHRGRAERYVQRFCNTRYSDLQFEPDQLAVVCLLLLRGPQTPGELRARSGRLHTFADNDSVTQTLASLMPADAPLAVKLAKRPGRRDAEYMHLFCGAVDAAAPPAAADETHAAPQGRPTDLEHRVARLEHEVSELRRLLSGRD